MSKPPAQIKADHNTRIVIHRIIYHRYFFISQGSADVLFTEKRIGLELQLKVAALYCTIVSLFQT